MWHNKFQKTHRRRAQVIAMVAVSSTVLMGFAAFSIDVGKLYGAKAELQRTADAAALAGLWEFVLNENRLKGDAGASTAATQSRALTAAYGNSNRVLNKTLTIDANSENALGGDMVFGRLNNPSDQSEVMQPLVNSTTNAFRITAHRDGVRNGPVPLTFAHILGYNSADVSASAVAAFQSNILGYKVTSQTGNADLLPFTLQVNVWDQLLAGAQTTGDNYAYDPVTKTVAPGQDGVKELNLYPGAGVDQLTPGNFGTVDIGSPNNSTADLTRQIRYGVNASDLSYFGGQLTFGSDSTLILQGDTGLSAAAKDDLEAIKGQPRSIPLFTTVSGNGNNANYTIVRFAGIRIMHVKLTGAMSKKEVIIQPAPVVDDAAVSGGSTTSSYVYTPPILVR